MLNEQQYAQLLKPLNPSRIAKRAGSNGAQLSYLEAWDVKAHLNRIFGFLNWSADVIETSLAFEEQTEKGMWNVAYKATLRLSINTGDGYGQYASYTEAAVGSSTQKQRGEAHDMAIKTAESDALKRAAINLGTQFGLSLYDDGSTRDVIVTTLDRSDTVSEGEPALPVTDVAAEPVRDSSGVEQWIEEMTSAVHTKDIELLLDIKRRMAEADAMDLAYQGKTLAKWLDKGIASVGQK